MPERLAFVCGAAGGMGIATALRLAADGFRVAAMDIDEARLAALAADLPPSARTFPGDITQEQDVLGIVEEVEAQMGPIDVAVNLVGWTEVHRFVEEDWSYWRKVIDINYGGTINVFQAVVPRMIERGRGKIVLVGSDAGKVGQSAEAVYAGCKGAIMAFAKSMARELARHGITVNVTSPGPTNTPAEQAAPEVAKERIIRQIPMRRMSEPEEQAAMIAFLCSADSDYITGQVYSVSGGLTMQ
jgi:2-hydroxycyclohexanecarboxyl-CoA dehydrogenase